MEKQQEIVEQLKSSPFSKSLSLVTYAQKSGFELLEIINEVLCHLQTAEGEKLVITDIRDETKEKVLHKLVNILRILRFKPDLPWERFVKELAADEPDALSSALHRILIPFPQNKERVYLAKYLAKINVPPEYAMDEGVASKLQENEEYKQEFIKIHKDHKKLITETHDLEGIKKEVANLQSEEQQLEDNIKRRKKNTADLPNFAEIFQATSNLRKEQEEETKLAERKQQQMARIHAADKQYTETARHLAQVKAQKENNPDAPLEEILAQKRQELQHLRYLNEKELPQKIAAVEQSMEEGRFRLSEPQKTEDDLENLIRENNAMEEEIERLNAVIDSQQKDNKLAMYRKHAQMVADKIREKDDELKKCEDEIKQANIAIESLKEKLSEISGPSNLNGKDFETFAAQLRTKKDEYRRCELELNALRDEAVLVSRTEQIVKRSCPNYEELKAKLEKNHPDGSYQTAAERLADVSEEKAQIDAVKGKTLEEISKIVTDLNSILLEKKTSIAPKVKELKHLRQQYIDKELEYVEKKRVFEGIQAGLDTEKRRLEQECDQFQTEAIKEETRFHELNASLEMWNLRQKKVADEKKYQRGDGKLSRDFPTWDALYTQRRQQQDQLVKELRKQQRELKDNASEDVSQRAMFQSLKELLQLKVKLTEKAETAARKQIDEDISTNQFMGLGVAQGADVMTLE
eukprot:TRINITY_DN4261_c0_g1_i1.p1 TRINITY_DN4261_c0_g1~~TRINITY_DN4261_c0_g1_i1.p1  ORF type:complete len:692 (+),score=288.33 TRINITY_DN4261_c0_g1_i1:65-2140(+)